MHQEDRVFSKRPWGSFQQYCLNRDVTVKIIKVEPGQALSVQKHYHRDELWVILDEGLVGKLGDNQKGFLVGEEVFIERGTIHSIENRGLYPARFLEISFGKFDENDIVRISDKYGRK